MTNRHLLRAFLTSACLAAIAAPAWAQTAPQTDKAASTVGEVVVTAQKRKERLQDVPESVAVVNSQQLQNEQVNSIADLNRVTPSLEIEQASNQNPGGGGQIRGIGTQTFATGAVGSVGIVVDQVSQGNANINNLFDVSSIEVLKGPQGTLFGLTTSAGVINIVTNAPDPNRYTAAVHTELSENGVAGSDYGQQVVDAMVNLPLSPDSALRIAATANLRQGVDENALDGKLDQHDAYSVRAHYLWRPNDKLSINIIGDYTNSNDIGADFFTITAANPGDTAALAACGVTVKPGNNEYCSNRPETNPITQYGLSAQIDYDLGWATLTSITSSRRVINAPGDSDIFRFESNIPQIYTLGADGQSGLLTEEARIASPSGSTLEYTAGVFLSRYNQYAGGGGINVLVILPFPPFPHIYEEGPNAGPNVSDTDDSEAVFGQATWHVNDKFRFIFGARYTHETLDLSEVLKTTNAPDGFGAATENNLSGKVGVQYDFSKSAMAYATLSQGYKGPQLNDSNPLIPAQVINPELPTDVEVGLKNTLLDGNLITDLSLFYDHVKNYQGQQCLPVPTGLACGPVNYSAVNSEGVEFNVFGRPLPGLTINTGLLYNPVKYPSGTLASDGSGDLGGTQLGNAPLWKFTFSGEYAHSVMEGIDGYLAADAVYKSDVNLDNSLDPNLHYPAHWMIGGRVGVRTHDQRYGAAIFVRNLTDNHEPLLIFPTFPNAGDYGTYYGPQSFRLVGLSLDARF